MWAIMPSDGRTPPSIFISYSHKDEKWKDRLLTHLRVLESQHLVSIWEDRQIAGGDEWLSAISRALEVAKIAIFLVSAHSLTSDFILRTEITRLLERREPEGPERASQCVTRGGRRCEPIIPCVTARTARHSFA
jgi:hypothetical protein